MIVGAASPRAKRAWSHGSRAFGASFLGISALTVGFVVAGAGRAGAAAPQPVSPPPLAETPPPTPPPPSPLPETPPAAEGATPAPATPGGAEPAPAGPPAAPIERKVATGDVATFESDHDAVRDTWGVEVRPVATRLPVFGLRAMSGCPAALTTTAGAAGVAAGACPPVSASALVARRWVGRNVALDGGLALALGGGSDGGRGLDTYFGAGPVLGASVLLANWRHVAIAAGPDLTVVVFRAAGSAATAYVAELRTSLEAELHFGFIGAAALSLGIRSGLAFRLEHAAGATAWSVGVGGATTVRALFEDIALRYYF